MYHYITGLELPTTIVMSKIDKIGKVDVQKSKEHTQKIFFGARVIAVSSTKGDGVEELSKILGEALKQK
jgi:GTP-binding protein EngB required for normal cell division